MTRRLAAIAAVLFALFLFAALLAMSQCRNAGVARTETKLSRGLEGAAVNSGAAAVEIVGNNQDRATATDDTVKEGTDAISSADPGDSNDAADRAACGMWTYRNSERCRRLLGAGPEGLANGSAAR